VSAAHDKVAFSPQDLVAEQFGQGDVVTLAPQHFLDLRIPPALSIANDKKIDVVGKIFRPIAVKNANAAVFEKRLHRLIDGRIGTRHAVSGITESSGDGAHRGAANAHEIEMFFGPGSIAHRKRGTKTW